jgi:hypothetical protein
MLADNFLENVIRGIAHGMYEVKEVQVKLLAHVGCE